MGFWREAKGGDEAESKESGRGELAALAVALGGDRGNSCACGYIITIRLRCQRGNNNKAKALFFINLLQSWDLKRSIMQDLLRLRCAAQVHPSLANEPSSRSIESQGAFVSRSNGYGNLVFRA